MIHDEGGAAVCRPRGCGVGGGRSWEILSEKIRCGRESLGEWRTLAAEADAVGVSAVVVVVVAVVGLSSRGVDWLKVGSGESSERPTIPRSSHHVRDFKIHKIYETNNATRQRCYRRSSWRDSEGQRRGVVAETKQKLDVDASDSPLPLHSHPEDGQQSRRWSRCTGACFYQGFLPSNRTRERTEQDSRAGNVGILQVIQLPYSSTRGKSSAKIVFELPTIHLRRLSGPSHPRAKHTKQRCSDGIAI